MTNNRRNFLKRAAMVAPAVAIAGPAAAQDIAWEKKVVRRPAPAGANANPNPKAAKKGKGGGAPRMSGTISFGKLIFISGVGYHQEGDIKVHTKGVIDSIKRQLEAAGSSMEKVLKANVYLNDLKDYAGMNEVYDGAWGPEPPCRTTVACAGGIPGNSLVEIDCIAYI